MTGTGTSTGASTGTHHGVVTVTLHWSIAVLTVVTMVSGYTIESQGLADSGEFRVHTITGMLVGGLSLVRIAWWLSADTAPFLAATPEGWRGMSATIAHLVLAVVPLALAVSGVGLLLLMTTASPLGVLPGVEHVPARLFHVVCAWLLTGVIVIHGLDVLHHHLVLRDGLLQRMWFRARLGRPGDGRGPDRPAR
ncbi:cytochrome b [Roseospira visakhapatnamensis]|uniref:Cytochrome b561 n=1 Tax=Roseospira visakhapatnamensis TaxID=390880 RepID=A0A7W6RAR0_9PROT|nr:cytochrome b/b6 domain-containing protein [Roseospira visakhapatnamensis]MBB4265073.1 cytochrome b561 [Roseospira visakhapatnamensis]